MVKETVDKRKKPETVTAPNKTTTTQSYREGGRDKGSCTMQFKPTWSGVIVRQEASLVAVPQALTPVFQGEQKGIKQQTVLSSNVAGKESLS